MPKRKTIRNLRKKRLDARIGERRGPGRPGAPPSEIVGRADNYRMMFWGFRLDEKQGEYVRDQPHDWAIQLLSARNADDAERVIQSSPHSAALMPLIPVILKVLNERSLPRKRAKQLDFLADSLAGRGDLSARRSRDISAEVRKIERRKSAHRILRNEYYVECSCGYKGPARDNACRKCGAEILIPPVVG
jgi:hypothetical protein